MTRLSLASHASRTRIKQLEKEETGTQRLVHVFATLEREVEDAVVDMFDNSEGPNPSASERTLSSPSLPSSSSFSSSSSPDAKELAATGKGGALTREERQSGLVLNETQQKLVRWLNTLPGLKKELAFIHPLRNSHGTIIARDVKRFPAHKIGEGVLRHWADHLIL